MPAVEGAPAALPTPQLRWRCDPSKLDFDSTAELDAAAGILGQDEAIEALRFGLEIHAPGQNIYVRGLKGTGRLTTVRRVLEDIQPESPPAPDHLYVHNFEHPDRPRLITVERGRGELFCEKVAELRRYILKELGPALTSELVDGRRKQLERDKLELVRAKTGPLEKELEEIGLAIVVRNAGGNVQPMILPLHEGKPVAPNEIPALIEAGVFTTEKLDELEQRSESVKERVAEVFREVGAVQRELRQQIRELFEGEAEGLLREACEELRETFTEACVHDWLDTLVHDVVHRRLVELEEIEKRGALYEVNPVSCHATDEPSPVIVESVASMRSLLGTIDVMLTPDGVARADHTCVRAGSLVQADGGVLVLEAIELLGNPGAWSALVRSLRSGKVELVLPERSAPVPSLKPEPIPVHVKIVLLGDARIYYALDQLDNDFPHLFKVLADFDEMLPREVSSVGLYARFLAKLAREEELPPFAASAVAELAEHGARIASARNKLTARFGRHQIL